MAVKSLVEPAAKSSIEKNRCIVSPRLALCCVIVFFCACTPRFDWRDYRDASGFVATFPGRVQSATRPIDLDGQAVSMAMHAARVGDTAFVIGSATLASSDPNAQARALDAIARALVQNISGELRKDEPMAIPAVLASEPAIPARALEVFGTHAGQPLHMVAWIAGRGDRVYQILVVGPVKDLESADGRDATDTFMGSVRLP
jgi:hypothetical protein